MNDYAPIALFVYKRVEHTQQTIEALKRNPEAKYSDLYIYSDGYKNDCDKMQVEKVREYIRTVDGFGRIIIKEAERNRGLASSVIKGVSEILSNHNQIIVVEDDLIVSQAFLNYMNTALKRYESSKSVFGITGYNAKIQRAEMLPECFFLPITSSWTWGTWRDRWDYFDENATGWEQIKKRRVRKDFNFGGTINNSGMLQQQRLGQNDSWWVRWAWTAYIHKGLYLTPRWPLCVNVGFDGTGTHCGKDENRENRLIEYAPISNYPEVVTLQKNIVKKVKWHYAKENMSNKLERIGYYLGHPREAINKIIHYRMNNGQGKIQIEADEVSGKRGFI